MKLDSMPKRLARKGGFQEPAVGEGEDSHALPSSQFPSWLIFLVSGAVQGAPILYTPALITVHLSCHHGALFKGQSLNNIPLIFTDTLQVGPLRSILQMRMQESRRISDLPRSLRVMQTQDCPSAWLGTRGQLDPFFLFGHCHLVLFLKSSSQLYLSTPALRGGMQQELNQGFGVQTDGGLDAAQLLLAAQLQQVICPLWITRLCL